LILGVSAYTHTVIPTATIYDVGTAATANLFIDDLGVAAGTSSPGTRAGVVYNASAVAVRITPDAAPAAATGKVRITIHYIQIAPPVN
jgi:hypothetical protein